MVSNIRNIVEKSVFGVCSYVGDKIGISTSRVRVYFIYTSFVTMGSPVIIYLLSILIKLSKIDHHFDEVEFGYLIKAGVNLGIPNHEVEQMVKNSTELSFTVPSSEQDRMKVLYYMLFLMKIDAQITTEEKEMLHHYGFKFGFSNDMIDDFVKIMVDYSHTRVPTELMLDVVRKYQN